MWQDCPKSFSNRSRRYCSATCCRLLPSVACDWVVSDWEYQSVGGETFEYGIKEILHESERDRLVYTDGTDTSSVAPSHIHSDRAQLFNNICQVAPMCTPTLYDSLDPPHSPPHTASRLSQPFSPKHTIITDGRTNRQTDRHTERQKKVKFSHTRHRALGSEMIPVYTQSAYRWLSHPPGGRLPLLSIRPAVTFPTKERHRPSAGRYQIILLGDSGISVCAACSRSGRAEIRTRDLLDRERTLYRYATQATERTWNSIGKNI